MKSFYTVLLFLLPLFMLAQSPGPSPVIRLRCYSPSFYKEPLIIVDGIPLEMAKLKEVNPNDIDSITVLKGSPALAIYGCRASEGVILITMKGAKLRKFRIKDFVNGNTVSGATLSFISFDKKDSLRFAGDDNGMIVTDKLKSGKEYNVVVSAVGYKSYSTQYKNISTSTFDFLLENDIKKFARLYPNPLLRGGTITIEYNSITEEKLRITILAVDGRILTNNPYNLYPGLNRISVHAQQNWTAGTYLVNISDETGKILKQDKLIIQ